MRGEHLVALPEIEIVFPNPQRVAQGRFRPRGRYLEIPPRSSGERARRRIHAARMIAQLRRSLPKARGR
jgi:hypothetical protein